MGVKVAITCLHWSQPSSPSSKQRSFTSNGGAQTWRWVRILDRAALLGVNSARLLRSRSSELLNSRARSIKRSCSASLDSFSDEEFSKEIQELALRFRLSGDHVQYTSTKDDDHKELVADSSQVLCESNGSMFLDPLEPPNWAEREEIIPASSIERKANSCDIPLSLRIIKRKKQWQEGIGQVRESAYCSMKRAFSSMVFIIRELHSYTLLQMRETLFNEEDLQGTLARVQKEIHASFVWLFQQVFSLTPTLMVYVMILLANYSVHSMAGQQVYNSVTEEAVFVVEDQSNVKQKFDSSAINKTFLASSSNGKSTSISGSSGGGGTYRPTTSGTDDDESSDYHRTILPEGASSAGEESVSGQVAGEEELKLWSSIEDEAHRMQSEMRDEALDHDIMLRFVSPINAKVESDDYVDYSRTELLYQTGIAQEPNNSLLLANYAQFLFLVAQDYDRAEEYFKRAVIVEPKDAEALNKYATFLWQGRTDIWAAEQNYEAAVDVEPNNSFYAANYAHFLWNTGGEDTCFPLDNLNDA